MAAKTSLFQSFSRLNNSSHKEEIIDKLLELFFDDILVRYCGFHKISSVLDKTITTSCIKSIEYFKEYLDNGWTLDIIPGIVYDSQSDKLVEVDFDWYYINECFEKQLNEYKGKGKILINNIK